MQTPEHASKRRRKKNAKRSLPLHSTIAFVVYINFRIYRSLHITSILIFFLFYINFACPRINHSSMHRLKQTPVLFKSIEWKISENFPAIHRQADKSPSAQMLQRRFLCVWWIHLCSQRTVMKQRSKHCKIVNTKLHEFKNNWIVSVICRSPWSFRSQRNNGHQPETTIPHSSKRLLWSDILTGDTQKNL